MFVKHMVPLKGNSSDKDANLRSNSLQPGEDDTDQIAYNFMERFEQRKNASGGGICDSASTQ